MPAFIKTSDKAGDTAFEVERCLLVGPLVFEDNFEVLI